MLAPLVASILVAAGPALFPPLLPAERPRAQLTRALNELGHAQLRARGQALAQVKTRADLERRREDVAAKIRRLLGPLPAERTPLGARVVGRLERPGFSIEKVIYESLPGFFVTANLYLPPGRGPFPGIIAPVGHYPMGKAKERQGADLARHGFVVLVPDPLGQGERLQHFDPELRASRAGVSSTDEHGQGATRAALIGDNLARYFVWDLMRGLDYLESRPEVDRQRLGATGCSGGGTQTTYLTALDPRIKVAAVACYLNDWAHLLEGPGPQEAEQSFPRFLAEGLDMGDYVALIAPRPLLVAATEEDFFPLAGARALLEEGRRTYQLLGVPERIALSVAPGEHGMPRESREAVSAFLLRWLGKGGDGRDLPDPQLHPEDLACTKTGQVATSLPARTVADLVALRARDTLPKRSWPANGAELDAHRQRMVEAAARVAVINAHPGGAAPRVTVHRTLDRVGYRLQVISLATGPRQTLWGLLALPPGKGRKPAALLADPNIRTKLARPGGELDQLARAGQVVLALEPRGAMVEADEPTGEVSLLGTAVELERRAEVVGKTLVGLRAEDFLHAFDLLAQRPDVDPARIGAFAPGPYAVPLLHAAVLDERVSRVILRDTLVSYRSVLDHPIHRNLPEIALPGVLLSYDLDDLMLALAPRRLTLINPLDPVGQSMKRSEQAKYLGAVLAAARAVGGSLQIVRWGSPQLLAEP